MGKSVGVWQKYGPLIVKMRFGSHPLDPVRYSLEKIGARFGVSRQRISELLILHLGSNKPNLPEGTIVRAELAMELGVAKSTLQEWQRYGKIKGLHLGRCIYFLPEEVEKARALADKHCLICGRAVPLRFSYCAECIKKRTSERRHEDYLRRKGYYQNYYREKHGKVAGNKKKGDPTTVFSRGNF